MKNLNFYLYKVSFIYGSDFCSILSRSLKQCDLNTNCGGAVTVWI